MCTRRIPVSCPQPLRRQYCAAHLGWAVVHCTSGDNMRSIEDIQAEVQEIVLKQLT